MTGPAPLRVGIPLHRGRCAFPRTGTCICGANLPMPESPAPRPALSHDAYYVSEQDDPAHPYGFDGHEFMGGDA